MESLTASLAAERLEGNALVACLPDTVTCGRIHDLPSANVGVAVLGDLLVGLLAGTGDGTLNSLRDVVGGLLDGLHCEVGLLCLRERVCV